MFKRSDIWWACISHNGRKVQKSLETSDKKLAQALEKAEIKDFTFHCLRHTFATRLAQNGVDIYKIAKLLNHKDLKNTQRYSHHCPESLMVGVQILEKFDYNSTTMTQNGG